MSHGSPGRIHLGNTTLELNNLEKYRPNWKNGVLPIYISMAAKSPPVMQGQNSCKNCTKSPKPKSTPTPTPPATQPKAAPGN
ncbi:hypothetical protein [[Phormidium] sp. ETS-05]|uniref:hypothetical protein n=1 Tax=[Phormidium] sp. ETS-05 TaxID=222819 RepID=UPI0035C8C0D8